MSGHNIEIASRYAVALGLVGVALLSTLAFQQVFLGRPSLFPFFAAVGAAAWLGGRGPGIVALALSAPLGISFYWSAHPTLNVGDAVLFLFFALCAAAGAALHARRQETLAGLRKAHAQLQAKADELERANQALIAEMGERQRAEAALDELRGEMARIARLTTISELAASIAHEVNQPLAAVVTNGGTLTRWLDGDRPNLEEARGAARRIVRDASHASQVIARVRAMATKALPGRAMFDLKEAADEVLALLQPELAKRHVTLHKDFAPDLPRLFGDRVQLSQVILNLAMNAIEAMSATAVRARRLTIQAQRKDAGTIELSVSDTGDGFQGCDPCRIFEPFVTTKPNGMGLGLAICRTIVEAHDGSILAESVTPCGARVVVTLPEAGP